MIGHAWTVFCLQAIIDQRTNTVTLVNAIEQLNVPADLSPGDKGPMCEIATLWYRTDPDVPAKGKAQFRILGPNGEETTLYELEIDLSEYERLRSVRGIQVEAPMLDGRYFIRVYLWNEELEAWEQVAAVPIKVGVRSAEDG